MATVSVENLYKSYNEKKAVIGLSFSAAPGEILGLIGPNGAGKSTTIKMILDFIKPDSGNIQVFGSAMKEEYKDRLGYLPEERGLYKKLSAIDLILYLASLKGMSSKLSEEKALELLKQTRMFEVRKKKINEMSRGMAQVIQFIVTVIHEPDLIILDEPFSGMDPVNTELVKNVIKKLRDDGKAIILSTHQMNQIEELCDKVLMLNNGKAVFFGDLNQTIKSRFQKNKLKVDVDGDLTDIEGILEIRKNKDHTELILEEGSPSQLILDRIRAAELTITALRLPGRRCMKFSWKL
jgi:ABC-2 type transport system ATP-binding protein